ncbi:MAG: TonB-dependent receptor [Bacteroidales bacterium]|nr:TonB-dependent receptor [Bacteroidales bacterium]MBN2819844.1 TonB-dependent receptor [Bacteroidales bacterium]
MKKRVKKLKKPRGIPFHSVGTGLLFLMALTFLLLPSITLYSQSQTISVKIENGSFEDVLKEIRKQTGMNYLFNEEQLQNAKTNTISIKIEKASVEEVLKLCFKDSGLTFEIIDDVIIIKPNIQKQKPLVQVIRGRVLDSETELPLPFASVVISTTSPLMGATTDENGVFRLEKVPVGRHNITVSYLGYETKIIPELMLTTGKEFVLNIKLKEEASEMDEVVVKAYTKKDKPLNSMTTVSARTFSVEETQRYAGGFDDPARLASAFAGISTTGDQSNNGIVIRGNAPKGLLWRMEGVDIPNPNHFKEWAMIGAGGISALSSLMLSDSDFLTGAFPAQYGNALSGVFDLKLRSGNNEKHEQAFQAGAIGLDFSSEGPLSSNKKASYVFNYRYSTFGIIKLILPDYVPSMNYQDFCFKLNFPTNKAGIFSVWGLGFIDKSISEINTDTATWSNIVNQQDYTTRLKVGVAGINHNYIIGSKAFIKSSVSVSSDYFSYDEDYVDYDLTHYQQIQIENSNPKFNFSSTVNYKTGARHTNRTGVVFSNTNYNTNIMYAPIVGADLESAVNQTGETMIYQFFTQSKVLLGSRFTSNIGLHSQYTGLNNEFVVEPRMGITYDISERQSVSLAYGKHSMIEPLFIYFADVYKENNLLQPNRDLHVTKAHHFIAAYDFSITPGLRLKIEPYYQYLYDVPVTPDSSFSTINLAREFYITSELNNEGTGTNIGIDFTLERFLKDGYYYLITASIFDSKYTGGDGIERNTMYNSSYVFNFLFGKEWVLGNLKNKILSASGKLNFNGGCWFTPAISDFPYQKGDQVILDYSNPFSYQGPLAYKVDATVNYRINRKKSAGTWTLHVINLVTSKTFYGFVYDYKKGKVTEYKNYVVVPSLSYKIEF